MNDKRQCDSKGAGPRMWEIHALSGWLTDHQPIKTQHTGTAVREYKCLIHFYSKQIEILLLEHWVILKWKKGFKEILTIVVH
jgi:hypothetical protein